MDFKGAVTTAMRFVARQWSSVIVGGATVGLVAANVWPPLAVHRSAFVVLVLSSLGVLLIEIRQKVESPAHRGSSFVTYRTMREARSLLLRLMLDEISKDEPTEIIIRGGRLRSIVEIIRELADRLSETRAKQPTRIRIYMLDPQYLTDLRIPGELSDQAQSKRNLSIAHQMAACVDELNGISASEAFVRNGVSIELTYYSEVPNIYYFVIGNANLVFGGFNWHRETSDLDGPASPCWHLNSDSPGFESVRAWLRNRALLASAAAQPQGSSSPGGAGATGSAAAASAA